MAQLTVYIDDKTLKQITSQAKIENSSISKWVKKRLTGSLKSSWPEGYFEVFGSLADVQLDRPEQPLLSRDTKRFSL